MNRPGPETSEYRILRWVLIAIAVLEALVRADVLPPDSRWSVVAAAVLAGLYALSRGLAKHGQPGDGERYPGVGPRRPGS